MRPCRETCEIGLNKGPKRSVLVPRGKNKNLFFSYKHTYILTVGIFPRRRKDQRNACLDSSSFIYLFCLLGKEPMETTIFSLNGQLWNHRLVQAYLSYLRQTNHKIIIILLFFFVEHVTTNVLEKD